MAAFALALIAVITYTACLSIYRLWFSPLAKFPGPRIAAFTTWYESYYDIVLKGQFSFHLDKLHQRYGKGSPDSCYCC